MPSRTLIAYYSMTGHTQRLASEIHALLGGDAQLEKIREPRERRGAMGMLRALFDAIVRRQPPIAPVAHLPGEYDLLILGGPIWAGRMASPVRTYASRYGSTAPRVAFFCTEGGRGAQPAFAELETLCHRAPCALLEVDHAHLEPARHREEMVRFAHVASTA